MALVWKASGIPSLRLSALSATLNLCQDYEPGQIAAAQIGILSDVEKLLSTSGRQEIQVSLRFLSAVSSKLNDSGQPLSANLISRCIIVIASAPGIDYDQDDFIACMDAFLPIVRDQTVQEVIGKSDHKAAIFDLLENTIIRLSAKSNTTHGKEPPREQNREELEESDEEGDDDDDDYAEDFEEIMDFASELVAIGAEVALHWEFDSPEQLLKDDDIQDLIQVFHYEYHQPWIRERPLLKSRASALMLGNIAQKDWISNALGSQEKLVSTAIEILLDVTLDHELRHATAGLLRNLAAEKTNKTRLSEANIINSVAILLNDSNLELKLAGLRLLQQLLKDSPANCIAFLAGSSADISAFETFQAMIHLNQSAASDGRLKTELGRVLVSLYRTIALNASSVDPDTSYKAANLASTEAISCITALSQHRDPRVISECWIGLTVVSNTKNGAVVVLQTLKEQQNFPKVLREALGQKTGSETPLAQKDKENVLVLVTYLLNLAEPDKNDAKLLKALITENKDVSQ
jgi:hypothetical protein